MALGEEACPRGLDAIMHGRDTSGVTDELARVSSIEDEYERPVATRNRSVNVCSSNNEVIAYLLEMKTNLFVHLLQVVVLNHS